MRQIEVATIAEGHESPGGMMMFLARLTQRGHNITSMNDLKRLYAESLRVENSWDPAILRSVAALPHGTIQRFAPITVAVVGASRRFLAQARTHQVGMNYVSASLQYSDYSGKARFVVPYPITEYDARQDERFKGATGVDPALLKQASRKYLFSCECAMKQYEEIAALSDNDTAGYAAPQGLRNILIMQGNHESWSYFIRTRACNRNTLETQYVALKIWEDLLNTTEGSDLFANIGPDCLTGSCREGKGCCGKPLSGTPTSIIAKKFPLLNKTLEVR